jgi:hypothetical protein
MLGSATSSHHYELIYAISVMLNRLSSRAPKILGRVDKSMSALGHSRRSDGQQGFADVRYAFNGDRICASQRTDAMCQ